MDGTMTKMMLMDLLGISGCLLGWESWMRILAQTPHRGFNVGKKKKNQHPCGFGRKREKAEVLQCKKNVQRGNKGTRGGFDRERIFAWGPPYSQTPQHYRSYAANRLQRAQVTTSATGIGTRGRWRRWRFLTGNLSVRGKGRLPFLRASS